MRVIFRRLALSLLCALSGCALTTTTFTVESRRPVRIDVDGVQKCESTPCEFQIKCLDTIMESKNNHQVVATPKEAGIAQSKIVNACGSPAVANIYFDPDKTSDTSERTPSDQERQEQQAFISATPHELCRNKDRLKRYENKNDCKADMIRRQDQARADIAVEDQRREQVRQQAIGILLQQQLAPRR